MIPKELRSFASGKDTGSNTIGPVGGIAKFITKK